MPGQLQAVYYAYKSYVISICNAADEKLHDTNIPATALMPRATKTEFALASGLTDADLFKNTASPRSVAEDGYKAMMKGKLDVISGLPFSQRISTAMLPFIPKKMILKQIRKMQELS